MLKDNILKTLYTNHVMVSGEALAEKFGVSRNTIWKNIRQLQREGFVITASTNKGYFLESCGRALSSVIIEQELCNCGFGKPIEFFETLNSTNIKAKALGELDYPSGTLIVAEAQSAGKGRLGRQFYSPGKQGVYFSILVRPQDFDYDPMLITSMCAAATAEAIEKTAPVKVSIKWVNDLYIKNKKVCGILTEAGLKLEDQSIDYIVIGIGINCGKQTFPAELRAIATSIENECDITVNRNRLIAETVKNIENGFKTMHEKAFINVCRARSNIIGKEITVCRGEKQYTATALRIEDNGALKIRDSAGNTEQLQFGEVRIKL